MSTRAAYAAWFSGNLNSDLQINILKAKGIFASRKQLYVSISLEYSSEVGKTEIDKEKKVKMCKGYSI